MSSILRSILGRREAVIQIAHIVKLEHSQLKAVHESQEATFLTYTFM